MNKIWIVIANASTARIYDTQKSQNNNELHLLTELKHPESRMKEAELKSDGSGKFNRGTFSQPTSAKQIEAQHFAHEIAKLLKTGFDEKSYERLILATSPHFYGMLNQALDEQVKKKLCKVLEKDYTLATHKELEEILKPYYKKTVAIS